MMIFENTKLALKSLKSSIMRTVLSLLGIVIGVASVVAILNLGNTAGSIISGTFESEGMDIITVFIYSSKNSDLIDEVYGENLALRIDGIENVSPVNNSNTRIRYQKDIKTVTVYGVESDYSTLLNYDVSYGRWFTAEENISKRQVVVLGAEIAEKLFPNGDAVGNYVSIFRQSSKRFLVIGVMEKKEDTIAGSFNMSVYIPHNTYTQRLINTDFVDSFTIKVKEGYDPAIVSSDIEELMNKEVGIENNYVLSAATLQEMAAEVTGTVSMLLSAIAGISLLVGGIGIMNIMLVTVAERTKEIGIRKALGASPKVIMGQFITEAIVLTLLGGLLGAAFGTGISYLIAKIADWGFKVNVESYVVSVGFSMLIGVFFGWYPARKAAKLDPIQALNYE